MPPYATLTSTVAYYLIEELQKLKNESCYLGKKSVTNLISSDYSLASYIIHL